MSWEVSTAPMCRACMEIDGAFISMDDEIFNKKNLLKKLMELTSIHVSILFNIKLILLLFSNK